MAPSRTTIASTQGLLSSQRAGYLPPPRDPWLSSSGPYGTVSTCSTTGISAIGCPTTLLSQPGTVFSSTYASQVAGVSSARTAVSDAAGVMLAPGNMGEISDCVIPSMRGPRWPSG